MEKKNRPIQQAANSDIRKSDITPATSTVQEPKRTPKNTALAFICCELALRVGRKMTFSAIAVFRLAGTMPAS